MTSERVNEIKEMLKYEYPCLSFSQLKIIHGISFDEIKELVNLDLMDSMGFGKYYWKSEEE